MFIDIICDLNMEETFISLHPTSFLPMQWKGMQTQPQIKANSLFKYYIHFCTKLCLHQSKKGGPHLVCANVDLSLVCVKIFKLKPCISFLYLVTVDEEHEQCCCIFIHLTQI